MPKAKGVCENCGAIGTMDSHHVSYYYDIKMELCRSCHMKTRKSDEGRKEYNVRTNKRKKFDHEIVLEKREKEFSEIFHRVIQEEKGTPEEIEQVRVYLKESSGHNLDDILRDGYYDVGGTNAQWKIDFNRKWRETRKTDYNNKDKYHTMERRFLERHRNWVDVGGRKRRLNEIYQKIENQRNTNKNIRKRERT